MKTYETLMLVMGIIISWGIAAVSLTMFFISPDKVITVIFFVVSLLLCAGTIDAFGPRK